jgi:hypothetical protein
MDKMVIFLKWSSLKLGLKQIIVSNFIIYFLYKLSVQIFSVLFFVQEQNLYDCVIYTVCVE